MVPRAPCHLCRGKAGGRRTTGSSLGWPPGGTDTCPSRPADLSPKAARAAREAGRWSLALSPKEQMVLVTSQAVWWPRHRAGLSCCGRWQSRGSSLGRWLYPQWVRSTVTRVTVGSSRLPGGSRVPCQGNLFSRGPRYLSHGPGSSARGPRKVGAVQ